MSTIANQLESVLPEPSERLQALVDAAVNAVLEQFAGKGVDKNQLAVTLADWCAPQKPAQGSYRGDEQIYPASVVKLFYLVAAHRWMEDGKLRDAAELQRAMHDMIVDSGNEATGYIVDLLTRTTSGPELSPGELEGWYEKRNAVNRYFASLGYRNINVNRKPWWEGPYGREQQSVQVHKPNHRNWLTTNTTARLLMEIVSGRAVSSARCTEMMKLLEREFSLSNKRDERAHCYIGRALPAGAKLWSKAGWTSQTRHDAAYVELPNGAKFVLVIFTIDHASQREIIPAVTKVIVEAVNPSKTDVR